MMCRHQFCSNFFLSEAALGLSTVKRGLLFASSWTSILPGQGCAPRPSAATTTWFQTIPRAPSWSPTTWPTPPWGFARIAAAHGLDFIPIEAVRCDLVIPVDLMDHPAVKIILDVLQTRTFREELAFLPGYESSCTGKVIGTV